MLDKLGFRPFGRGYDWCAARSQRVEAIYYALQHAEAGHAPVRSTWTGWLGFASHILRNFSGAARFAATPYHPG